MMHVVHSFLLEAYHRLQTKTPRFFRHLQKVALAVMVLDVALQVIMSWGYAPSTHRELLGHVLLVATSVLGAAQFACDGEVKIPRMSQLLGADAQPPAMMPGDLADDESAHVEGFEHLDDYDGLAALDAGDPEHPPHDLLDNDTSFTSISSFTP